MRGRIVCGAIVCLATLLSGGSAHAKLRWARGAGCRSGGDARVVVKPVDGPVDRLIPIPKKKRVPKLEGAPLVVIDVSVTEALPTRRNDVPTRKPPKTRVTLVDSRSDFRCIGIPRGRAGISRVVGATPGARFWGHPHPESWRRDNIAPAGVFNLTETIPHLMRTLKRPIPESAKPWQRFQLWAVKKDAAIALADMGHNAAAKPTLAMIEALASWNLNVWEDALPTLGRLDPALAERYALKILERELSTPSKRSAFFVDEVLGFVRTRTPETLALVTGLSKRLKTSRVGCRLLAARIRLGDAALVAEVRPHLAGTVRSGMVVNCYSEIEHAVAPGTDPDQLDIILHRHGWEELVTLLEVMAQRDAASPSPDPRRTAARDEIRAFLVKQKTSKRIARDESDRRYTPTYRARFLAAYAHTHGTDTAAHKTLLAFISDGSDTTTAPYIAARDALRLDVPGAADAAAKLLLLGRKRGPRRFSSRTWDEVGHLHITETSEVVLALHQRKDARFALGLLHDDGFANVVTASLVARHPPSGAICDLVVDAASDAQKEHVDFAFWALSTFGPTCRPAFLRAARDSRRPPHVRGMATEALAMLREPAVAQLLNVPVPKRAHLFRAALERARIIAASPE